MIRNIKKLKIFIMGILLFIISFLGLTLGQNCALYGVITTVVTTTTYGVGTTIKKADTKSINNFELNNKKNNEIKN